MPYFSRPLKKSLGLVCASLLSSSLLAPAVWAGSLEYWKFDLQDSRLDIITDDDVRPQVSVLRNPTRVVVDLPGIKHRGPTIYKPLTQYIKEARVGQLNNNATRIVLELAEPLTIKPWEVQVRGLAPNRWYARLPIILQPSEYRLPEERVAVNVPAPPPRTLRRFTVVLDAGHGGNDPGAIGQRGLREKDLVLAITKGVARELEKQGISVVMTRNSDIFVSLQGRVQRADAAKADIFVSIHANSIGLGQPQVNGIETYYFQTGRSLAQTIHRSILQRLNVRDRRVRQARFYVLRNSAMPSTLVEVGFVTGNEDSRNLSNGRFRQQMAEAIAAGIVQYLK
jgi:N-acetylmuramoyl-L-alanine amidase